MPVPSLPPASVAHRSQIAQRITQIRRTRPKVSFNKLQEHRIPTLWTLYRGLLRYAPGENVKFRVRMVFEQNRHTTSAHQAQCQLRQGYKYLNTFYCASRGDEQPQRVTQRYESMIATKRSKEYWRHTIREAFAWQEKLRTRPINKGSFLSNTTSNPFLPRLSPQPAHINGMIRKRRAARSRRLEQLVDLQDWVHDVQGEGAFERSLGKLVSKGSTTPRKNEDPFEMSFGHDVSEWESPMRNKLTSINASQKLDLQRARSPNPAALRRLLWFGKMARREKVENKARERARERAGVETPSSIARKRQAAPAYLQAKMTEQQRHVDKVIRSPSEVGYVGMVKRRVGMRLANPDTLKSEESPARAAELDRLAEAIREENERRRKAAQDEDRT
ncbi:hypothetical protein CONPUDRAFT_166670 [Coniophora puteana RWD-64-598 SS2]|uniref:Uncharacterized protein n=1 Tax=Coniophora puteana (strain RWD-64-598) TaxID=741705 RepID=A0A5M3MLP1_CONPW|nr:uncharacterized protein CONPUDRAFT_166670 [Coniophora puteana RWD-64-598 SS2]EIW80078.1 hypothetical protein CONPUDRAFT_166670 [Coniophora puteana RWD-64-598 SS2]